MAKGAKPTARRPPMVFSMVEVDSASQDPALLDAIRKKNSAALPLTAILDPRNDKDSSSTDDAVWHIVTNGNHVTGNLNLLTDLMPVFDRWVSFLGGPPGPPMQVRARGSVNYNEIRLDDVWYVPECKVNVVAIAKLTQDPEDVMVSINSNACSIEKLDGTIVGKGHHKDNLYELDFLNTISMAPCWYIVSNATEHMTGNLHLLTNFTPTRPSRSVRTHAGAMLQVCGSGALSSNQLAVPGVSYVPGLAENIISVSQLIDSGFSVTFGPNGCIITRNRDAAKVGKASRAGGQLYRLHYLRVAPIK